jgi:antitoxin PrlF
MNQPLTFTDDVTQMVATITSKGQVTIPAGVRKRLGLKTHDKIAFVVGKQGEVQLQVPKYPTLSSLRGAAGELAKPLSWKEMLAIAREDHLAAEHTT